MIKKLLAPLLLLPLLACGGGHAPSSSTKHEIKLQFTTFPVNSSVRAIKALDANTLWYAGQKGQFGYTNDGGQNWHIDSINVDGYQPGFRAIDITKEAVFLLSTDSPAMLFKSTDEGKNWEICLYRDDHPDAIILMPCLSRITRMESAVGDETDSCLSYYSDKGWWGSAGKN